jgi:hypothetical protein
MLYLFMEEQFMDTEKLKEEFKELCKPLNEWLQKKLSPPYQNYF